MTPAGPYLWSGAGVGLATGLGLLLSSAVPLPNVSMVFLLAVVFSAARFGTWPALATSFLSFFAYNFFFTDPLYTFVVAQPHELLALGIFLVVAILTSTIAGQAREQTKRASDQARASRGLYEFANRLSGLANPEVVLDSAIAQIEADFGQAAVILLAKDGELELAAASPGGPIFDGAALDGAGIAFGNSEPTGTGTAVLPNLHWVFLPLRTPHGPVGVLAVAQGGSQPGLDADARTLLETVAELTATALERARLGHEITTARTAAESEKVRNTLLTSVSHDFRTPLASILGAATALIEYGAKLPETTRGDLLAQVKDEAEHLDGMVRNLLAITRVEAGALELSRDWIDLRELMDRTVALAKRRGAAQAFEVVVEGHVPLISADPNLIGQVLSNVVGNAARHAGPDAGVVLIARLDPDGILLSVTDDGPGIPSDLLPRIFEKFVRRPSRGDAGKGSGLGLAIAKGIVEAHGGRIAAESPVEGGRGTRILIFLPVAEGAP